MSDNINNMNVKQLRNEVQSLRDELAIMKRQYEDIIYNLDTDNFSQRVVKQGKDMYSKIEQNAEGISLQAEKVEENKQSLAKLQVTADGIQSEVKTLADTDEQLSSRITQTANLITSEVKKLTDKDAELSTKIEQTAEEISLQAEKIEDNETKVAELSVKADEISSIAKVNISAHFEIDEAPTNANTDNEQKTMLCLYEGVYYYYNDITEKWEVYPENGLQTLFVQDGTGFRLYGDIKVDGSCVLTDSLTFNASDKPVQVEYSVDGTTNWHTSFVSGSDKFMRLKIGSQWSDAMKIVGSDGKDGKDGQNGLNGDDATVTPQAVFNALTNSGANQGIFAAFVKNNNQIYINAEYLATKIANVHDVIYIGDENTTDSMKKIVFNSAANIRTFLSGAGYHYGLAISSNGLHLEMKPTDIEFIHPNSGSFGTGSISLADYVSQYAGGSGGTGGTPTAVFG